MGLFDRKKTEYFDAQPYYTIGNFSTILIVGLGNPGKEYVANRHNLGFMAIDKYQSTHDFTNWVEKKDLKCLVSEGMVGSTKVILAKPTTFMNNSGEAVQKIQKYYRLYSSDTTVVYDELDVNFGTIRTRIGGSSAGHKGIKSIATYIDEDFCRVRVGIGPKSPPQIDSADYVLQDFSDKEKPHIHKILNEVCTILDERTAGPLTEHSITIDL